MSTILIIAGEASGDIHGAALMSKIKAIDKLAEFTGIGGGRMIDEGLNAKYHIKDMAFLGFVEVVKHLPFIRKVQTDIIEEVKRKDIKKVVLIDYPGFNLNIAKKLKQLGVKIFYYISPQIWAWGNRRIKKIRRRIDKMIVVFPFEEKFYKESGIDVEFVGHPLIERISEFNFDDRTIFITKNKLNPKKDILLLMPGSRRHEIEKIFPETIKAADKLAKEFGYQVVVACPENIEESIFDKYPDYKFTIIKNESYNLFKHAKFGIIKSGTSTMEAAIIGLPFTVVYATSQLTYLIGKTLVNVKNIAMPNIIAGKEIVKEFIQNDLTAEKLFNHIKILVSSPAAIESMKSDLTNVKEKLGNRSASELAAKIICA